MKAIILAAALSCASTLPAKAISQEQFQETAAKVFQPIANKFDIPGLSVGITLNGKYFVYNYGKANLELIVSVTGDTIFELGSISKLFTVTLAALAEQQGKLDLKAPVSQLVPGLSGSAFDKITLSDLAAHTTAGLPLQVPSSIKTKSELMKWLKAWQPNTTNPMRSYSNVSIGLLGDITAKSMGMEYAEAAEGTLFPALGLSNTFINVPTTAENRYAYGYSREDNSPIRVTPGILADEAYGAKSSVNDMLKFLDVSLGRTDDPTLRAAVNTTQTGLTKTEFYTQNMIWEQYPWPVGINQLLDGNSAKMAFESQPVEIINPPLASPANIFFNKTGATNGFGGYVAIIPSEDFGIVILANRNYPNEERIKAAYSLLEQLNILKK